MADRHITIKGNVQMERDNKRGKLNAIRKRLQEQESADDTVEVKSYIIKKNDQGHLSVLKSLRLMNSDEGHSVLRKLKTEHNPSTDSSKLREFLNRLEQEDETIENYRETPIYRLGHEDGFKIGHEEGYSEAYYELFKVLKAIETLIQPHIENEC